MNPLNLQIAWLMFRDFITPRRSVSSIATVFDRMIGQLEECHRRHIDAAATAEVKAAKLVQTAVRARSEAHRARRLSERVNALLK